MVAPKLTNEDRYDICQRYITNSKLTYRELAAEYGVSVATIHNIVTKYLATGDWKYCSKNQKPKARGKNAK